jgi:hypothetical protein
VAGARFETDLMRCNGGLAPVKTRAFGSGMMAARVLPVTGGGAKADVSDNRYH